MEVRNYEIGQLVAVNDKLCSILDIQKTNLGFRSYSVVEVDSGIVETVSKHQLKDVEETELNLDEELIFQQVSQASTSLPVQHNIPELKDPETSLRHAVLSYEELMQ